MHNVVITATATASVAEVKEARLGSRFGRMDLASQLALLAVEKLGVNFDSLPRERIAICLAARTSSLTTDAEYWQGRDNAGGPSPTLFTYTLPSAAIGEIAIRHRLTGPNLCFVGPGQELLPEAKAMLQQGEADACVCVSVNVVSDGLAKLIQTAPAAAACAVFLQKGDTGPHVVGEFDRDIEALCATLPTQTIK
jgi:3-oxoacyl-(acyl-carrier-protein) synthase